MKNKPIAIVAIVCTCVFLVFGIASCALSRNYQKQNGDFDFDIHLGDSMMSDEAEVSLEGVDTIIISTIDSDVTFVESNQLLTSQIDAYINYEAQKIELSSYVEGATAYIEVIYPTASFSSNSSFSVASSNLTVGLPEDFTGQIDIETKSGDVMAVFNNSLSALNVSTVSGDLAISVPDISSISFYSQSGGMRLDLPEVDNLSVDTKSGELDLYIAVDDTANVSLKTISGAIYLSSTAPCATDITTTSGDITIDLPKDSVFQLRYSSFDGDYSGKIITSEEGPLYEISTISGDLSFE